MDLAKFLITIGKQAFVCKRCGYTWLQKEKNNKAFIPKQCPNCKSPYWNKNRSRFLTKKDIKKIGKII